MSSPDPASTNPLPSQPAAALPAGPAPVFEVREYAPPAIGTQFDASVPVPLRELTAADLGYRRRRRRRQPLILFIATCLSTYFVGATHWLPHLYLDDPGRAWQQMQQNWQEGLTYMLAVMSILLMHEMGHFLQTLRYHVPASLPLFLPLPIAMTGTMGAVILMDTSRANRKQLFDIGLSGPVAGLVVAIPMIWWGIKYATPDPTAGEFPFGVPLIFEKMMEWVRPDLKIGAIAKNPFFMAGWVGMLVTGLNMLPVSQLDGGHVIYGMFGRNSKWFARAFICVAIAFVVISEQDNWIVMLVLVLLLGVDHPPTRDDGAPIGTGRFLIGLASLLIPVFCFTPKILPASW